MVIVRVRKAILLVVAVLLHTALTIRAQRMDVVLFNSDNGLPQSFVNTLIQDSVGFLWIGTQDGLCRYDGYEFMVFNNNPYDSLSISSNYINHIVEGKNGELWVATRIGLNRYDRLKGAFRVYSNNPRNQRSLASNLILGVYRDRDGNIWVKTQGVLHLYNPATDDFTRFSHYNDIFNLPLDTDHSPIFEDSQGRLWLGTKDGLFFFDKERMLFKHYQSDPSNANSLWGTRVQSIFEHKPGKLLVGTEKGLSEFDPTTQKFTRIPLRDVFGAGTGSTLVVQFIGRDVDSSIWIGTLAGLGKLKPSGEFIKYNNLQYNNVPVGIVNVSTVLRDRSGVLWIGSQTGLVKVNPFEQRLGGFSKDEKGNNLFSNNIVSSVLESSDGNIWIGTWGSGLHLFNPKNGQNKRFATSSSSYIPNDFIHSIVQLRSGAVIVGTRNGVYRYHPGSGSFIDFFESQGVYAGDLFRNNRVYSIEEDSLGRIWFATQRGLHCLRQKTIISFYSRKNDSLSLPGNEVYDVAIDNNTGEAWVATIGGLSKINRSLNGVGHFAIKSRVEKASFEVLCLRQSYNGIIWVGTTSGLFWVKPKTGNRLQRVLLPGNNIRLINDIQEDTRGRLWISTNKGIVMYNPLSGLVRNFTKADGLFSNELNINASFKNKEGWLYFGGVAGVNLFHPDSIPLNKVVPNVCITRIQVFQKSGNSEIIPYENEFIEVSDDFSNLSISIAALDYIHPEHNSYRYRLKGFDSRWVELGNKNVITFTNLPEGTYKLDIMGSNSDQVWMPEYKTLVIRVVAPWWRSRLAQYVYALLVLLALVIYAIRRNRHVRQINRLLKEREMVLEQVQEQKEELIIKNKNITDSINYAKRIQDAMLPAYNTFKEFLPESFVIFKPKDIVSGDFYWVNETRNKTFVAVVDCTGHGVPGAFMSIIGIELLRNITNVEGVDDAAEILNRLSVAIHNTFAGSNQENRDGIKVKDGMDVSFCVIDKEYNILQFSGAFSNLFLVRDGRLIEIRGDRYSVGMANELGHSQFSSYYIPIQPNDMIYMFTDGVVDQFGGPEGKKFKYRRFRNLLLNNYMKHVDAQRKEIESKIDEWKGTLEQVDDILIIGIRPELSCLF